MVPLAVHVPEFREDSIGREVVGKDDVRVLDVLSSRFVFFFLHFCSIFFSLSLSRDVKERERERVLARGFSLLFFKLSLFSTKRFIKSLFLFLSQYKGRVFLLI